MIDKFIEDLKNQGVKITNLNKLKLYIEEKSVYRYRQIFDVLKRSNKTIQDTHLNDFYRYDIRIRRLLFKYLTVYEIKLRGKILNSASGDFDKIENLDFGKLIHQYYDQGSEIFKVKTLRNYVFHHRMIQLLPIDEILVGINMMIKNLDKKKFCSELVQQQENLTLIYAFKCSNNTIEYGEV